MEKKELVIELGVEEIPASMLENASRQFEDSLLESLKGQRLSTGAATRWHTPRRIIVATNPGLTGSPVMLRVRWPRVAVESH